MKRTRTRRGVLMTAVAPLLLAVGCQSAYFKGWEALGYHKRDLLVEEVGEARDAQEAAKEQFESALEQFSAATGFHGGELEDVYRKLKRALESSESKVGAVREEIDSVERVAGALFREWETELDQYASADLRRSSEQQMAQTQQRYGQLIGAMKRAESKMEPVLIAFRDQVLFLKHNLNAQAIASLQNQLDVIRSDVSALIREMEASIAESNAFIAAMQGA